VTKLADASGGLFQTAQPCTDPRARCRGRKHLKLFLRTGVLTALVPHNEKHDRMVRSCFQAI